MAKKDYTPKWVTPERQACLVKLFADSQGFCIYGHKPCKGQWTEQKSVVCAWGKPCSKPQPNELCRFKPDYGKPHLPCEVVHVTISHWHCAYGDYPCYGAKERIGILGNRLLEGECHYAQCEARLVKAWSADDRAQSLAEYQAEFKAIHKTNDRTYPLHGKFSGVSQDVFYDKQPEFFVEAIGVSGLTYKPFAKVRLASSFMRLHVDLKDTLKPVSKNKKRKALRYGKVTTDIQDKVHDACWLAVKHYLNW